MTQVAVYDIAGKKVKDISVPKEVFEVVAKPETVALAARVHMDNKRLGLASTKRKADVKGGGQKPFRQKGTGRARQGSTRAPHYIGGGVVFGPLGNDNYSRKLPKKIRRHVLFAVLSDKLKHEKFAFVDFKNWDDYSVKKFQTLLSNLPDFRRCKFILNIGDTVKIKKSGGNLPNVSFTSYNRLPIDELLKSDFLFFDLNVLEDFLSLYSPKK